MKDPKDWKDVPGDGDYHIIDIITEDGGTHLASVVAQEEVGRLCQATQDIANLIVAAKPMLRALKAVVARLSGEWDNPDLLAQGPLGIATDLDVLHIAKAAIRAAEPDK